MLYISHVVETTEEEEEEDPCFSFSNSRRHGKVGPFFAFFPFDHPALGRNMRICVFQGNTVRSDQSFSDSWICIIDIF